MCLHDINLEVDLSRHNLNHPGQEQQYDGTQPPRSQTAEQKIGELEEDAPNHLDYSWTGPWPTVHFIAFLQPLENTLLLAKFWVDILGLWGVDQFDFQLIDESTMSDGEIEALAQSASNDFAPMFADLAAL
ncbi:MAG: hypothetical protein EAX95_16300, partial [Candidatus Thorarchaeota archaeon]|nr:hypothetical protein [Candidatus Thorarchaeota archaeon]